MIRAVLAAPHHDELLHPLVHVADADIRGAFAELVAALDRLGLGYSAPGERNLQALSLARTAKTTLYGLLRCAVGSMPMLSDGRRS